MSPEQNKEMQHVLETQVSIGLSEEVDFSRSLKNEIEAAVERAEGGCRQREREEQRPWSGKAWPTQCPCGGKKELSFSLRCWKASSG